MTKGFISLNFRYDIKEFRLVLRLIYDNAMPIVELNSLTNIWIEELFHHKMLDPKDISAIRVFSQSFFSNKMVDNIHIGQSDVLKTQSCFIIEENRQHWRCKKFSSSNIGQSELAKDFSKFVLDWSWNFTSRRSRVHMFSEADDSHFIRGRLVLGESWNNEIEFDLAFVTNASVPPS